MTHDEIRALVAESRTRRREGLPVDGASMLHIAETLLAESDAIRKIVPPEIKYKKALGIFRTFVDIGNTGKWIEVANEHEADKLIALLDDVTRAKAIATGGTTNTGDTQ